jgi:hypothetical protein
MKMQYDLFHAGTRRRRWPEKIFEGVWKWLAGNENAA